VETSELTVNLLPISLKYAVERPLKEWKKQEDQDDQNSETNQD